MNEKWHDYILVLLPLLLGLSLLYSQHYDVQPNTK